MNKYNTILGQMLALVPRFRFENLDEAHKTERGAKGLKSWQEHRFRLRDSHTSISANGPAGKDNLN
jgi:hypothetical protein